jgi:DNA-binding SARP family transcriptional activator
VVDFRVLGPIQVWDQTDQLDIGAPRNRTVLALLLASPGQLVSVNRIVDELWPAAPPTDARLLAQGYVSRLRRALRGGATGAQGSDRLVTRRPGYVLTAEEQELDTRRFAHLVKQARSARVAGHLSRTVTLFRRAQDEWHGVPFADAPRTPALDAEAIRLEELRVQALEEQFDTELAVENKHDLVPELTKYTTLYPLRSRLVAQLMLALHRSGRSPEALELYRHTIHALADELGLDPPAELRQLQLAILRNEQSLLSISQLAGRLPAVGSSEAAEPARPAGSPITLTVAGPTYRPPIYDVKRQYLTAYPDAAVHGESSIERTVWLTNGTYTVSQLMGDAEEQIADTVDLHEGTYTWKDRLVPASSHRYRHETTLVPDTPSGDPVSWTDNYWRLAVTGEYVWGSKLNPEF